MRHHLSSGSPPMVVTAAMCRERAHASLTRVTKEGRTLTYFMTVIQQPERARACGSGAKSSADRRPVDPPPVVELRIFEGDGPDRDRNDVTFTYSANFFLFTTLEIARPVAHGRMQAPAPQVPVLTGMPVSGMAYLDRPSLAGYFIFPDLSVRHEGRYRLSFNLYEETKEAKDTDAEPSNEPAKPSIPGSTSPNASFDWRVEVKSAEFVVYSAKKFPGLAESTHLSRVVAEQGCRVRIRRDVRMRRRDGKPNGDYEASVEDEYARAGRTPSIQEFRERSRSLSNESLNRQAYPDMERRMSGEYARPYPHPGARPQSYLTFGGQAANQYQAPPPRFAQPAPPALPSYQQGPPAPHPHEVQYRQPAPPPQEAFSRPPHPLPTPASNQPLTQHDQYETKPQHPQESPSHRQTWQNGTEYSSADDMPLKGPMLPPIRYVTHKVLKRETQTPLTPIDHVTRSPLDLAPREQRAEHNHLFSDRVLPPLPAPVTAAPAPAPATTFNKRSHQAAFDPKAKAQDQPLFNGMRPEDALASQVKTDEDSDDAEDDDSEPAYLKNMTYKRANGTFHTVLHPPT